MRHRVTCDLPGRIRVRFGALAFDDRQGYGVAKALLAVPGVDSVSTASANGSVLVLYEEHRPGCRARVLEVLGSLVRGELPEADPTDAQRKVEADSEFVGDLARMVGGHFLRKAFMPMPVRTAFIAWRAIGFIRRGLYHLLVRHELSVEVLDAAAVVAALVTGSVSTASSNMLLLRISDRMERYTHERNRLELAHSLALNVERVWVVDEDGTERQVPFDQVVPGDLVCVRTGSMVPVDGEVVQGSAAVNESSMTGEPELAAREEGSSVYAGTVVEEGSVVVRARQVGFQTRIHNIVRMVDESESLKAGAQSRAERLADAIVPFSLLAFVSVLALTRNVPKAMSVLMVDYSCAIKLSTPAAVMSALSEAASRGMVAKGGRYLEQVAAADTIVFDKTGTLTLASPKVRSVVPLGDMPEEQLLRVAACLEEHFPHSMARAVVAEAARRGIEHADEAHAEVEYVVAHGICSHLGGKKVLLGSGHFLFEDNGVPRPDGLSARIAELAPGCSCIYMAVDGKLTGAICIEDPVRPEAVQAVRSLKAAGFSKVIMLTGDSPEAAAQVARTLGIDEFRAQVLPEDKAGIVNELRAAGRTVLMVGDGVNDAPALACADCSAAMVDASDIAREVADVTLLNCSLEDISTLRLLSRELMGRVERNYRIIVGFNTMLLVLGVLGVLQPSTSALLHNGSTALLTAANMRRLLPADAGNGADEETAA